MAVAEAAFFPTSLGWMAIAWTPIGIRAVVLPAATRVAAAEKLADQLVYRSDTRPKGWVVEAIHLIERSIAGEAIWFGAIPLDFSGVSPNRIRIYEALRRVRRGSYVTYRELAELAALPRAARAIGSAMAKNPLPLIVPCHRVIRSDGRLGGFSAEGGVRLKALLLASEGIPCRGDRVVVLSGSDRRQRRLGNRTQKPLAN